MKKRSNGNGKSWNEVSGRCRAYSQSPFHVLRAIHVLWGQSTKPNISCVVWVQTCSQNWEEWRQVRQVRQVNKYLNWDTLWHMMTGCAQGLRPWSPCFSAGFGRRSGFLPNGREQKHFKQTVGVRCFSVTAKTWCQQQGFQAAHFKYKWSVPTLQLHNICDAQRWATSCQVQKVQKVLSVVVQSLHEASNISKVSQCCSECSGVPSIAMVKYDRDSETQAARISQISQRHVREQGIISNMTDVNRSCEQRTLLKLVIVIV